MLIIGFDAYLTPMSHGAVTLVHKSINLEEPYKEGIKEKVITEKYFKKKTGSTWNTKAQRHSVQKVFFKFCPLFVELAFEIYINNSRQDQQAGN